MAGLANSRHATHSRRPTRNDTPTANLAVTPAPITLAGAGADIPIPRPPPIAAATSTTAANGPTDTPDPAPRSAAPQELARYTKIIRRLQWKLPFLAQGYRQAVDRLGADPAAASEAELMFKLDFFEYYMLIERALVHLLGVFGVDIPRGHAPPAAAQPQGDESKDSKYQKGLAGSVWRDGARHRYHANVLAALDREDNPLHGTLGTGEVRAQLGRAKQLRNRWKTAGEEEEGQNNTPEDRPHGSRSPAKGGASPERTWRTRKIAAPLDSYRLEHMLEVIFQGFDEAFKIAEGYVRGGLEWGDEGDMEMLEAVDWTAADDEDQWEFMVDAMDWEAV